jgi:hypothetical protein
MPRNQLGVLVNTPNGSRLEPPLSPDAVRELHRAFLSDTLERIQAVRAHITVFAAADDVASLLPRPWPVVARPTMPEAFEHLLGSGARTILIGSNSPDLPLPYLKRAFQRLKHRDVVIGPSMNGGYYLIGLRAPAPALFEGIEWGSKRVFAQTMDIVAHRKLSVSLLPPWYQVDDEGSLQLLNALCGARRLAGGVHLPHTERILSSMLA